MQATDEEIRATREEISKHGKRVALLWSGLYPDDMEEGTEVFTRMLELQDENLPLQEKAERPEAFLCIRQRGITPGSVQLHNYVTAGFTTRFHADAFLNNEECF